MGRLSSLLGKMKNKRNELVRRAASNAADAALGKTKDAARGALDAMSDTIEKAIFGDVLADAEQERARSMGAAAHRASLDPFAKIKVRERDKERPHAPPEEDVDAELRELKKRLGG